jgi:hypothetical protein
MRGEPATRRETVEGVRTARFSCRAKSDSLIIMVESRTGTPFRTWSWASKPENESQHFIGRMRLGCANRKAPHFVTQFRHLLFGRRKNRNREQTVKSSTSTKSRDGGTGRRSGFIKPKCLMKLAMQNGTNSGDPRTPPGLAYLPASGCCLRRAFSCCGASSRRANGRFPPASAGQHRLAAWSYPTPECSRE